MSCTSSLSCVADGETLSHMAHHSSPSEKLNSMAWSIMPLAPALSHPAQSCPVLSHTVGPGTVWQIFGWPGSKLTGKVISFDGFLGR